MVLYTTGFTGAWVKRMNRKIKWCIKERTLLMLQLIYKSTSCIHLLSCLLTPGTAGKASLWLSWKLPTLQVSNVLQVVEALMFIVRPSVRQSVSQWDSQSVSQSVSETVRQSDRQTYRQTDRQTDRQTERQIEVSQSIRYLSYFSLLVVRRINYCFRFPPIFIHRAYRCPTRHHCLDSFINVHTS